MLEVPIFSPFSVKQWMAMAKASQVTLFSFSIVTSSLFLSLTLYTGCVDIAAVAKLFALEKCDFCLRNPVYQRERDNQRGKEDVGEKNTVYMCAVIAI